MNGKAVSGWHVATVFVLASCFWGLSPRLAWLSLGLEMSSVVDPDPLGAGLRAMSFLLLVFYAASPALESSSLRRLIQRTSLVVFPLVFVVLPMASDVYGRAELGLQVNGQPVSMAHDGGVLQTEAGLDGLVRGESPYEIDYRTTEMALGADSHPSIWQSRGFAENPAFDFVPYPPGVFVVSFPVRLASLYLFGMYDQRFTYLIAFVLLVVGLYRLGASRGIGVEIALCGAMQPFMSMFLIQGRNDVLVITSLVWAILLMRDKRWVGAALVLALATAFKQFAWFYLPTLFLAGFQLSSDRATTVRAAIAFVVASGLLWVPFLIQAPSALVSDVLLSQTAASPWSPRGFSITGWLVMTGLVNDFRGGPPIELAGYAAALLIIGAGMYRIRRAPSLASASFVGTAALTATFFFARMANDNHTAVLLIMALTGLLLDDPREGETSAAADGALPPTAATVAA